MPLDTLLRRHAAYRPDHLAVVCGDHRLTTAGFNRRVNRLANALLAEGLGKGDAVATVLDNSIAVLEIYHAVAKTGMVVVPLSPLLRGPGLRTLIADSGAVAVVTMERLVPDFDEVRDDLDAVAEDRWFLVDGGAPRYRSYVDLVAGGGRTEPPPAGITGDDIYNIVYSSGTTGLPKGIVHTHAIREAYGTGFASSFRMRPESVVLHAGSLVFNGSFLTLMPALYLGCTYVLLERFDVDATIDAIEEHGVTHIVAVPSQIIALLGSPRLDEQHAGSLEMLLTVGAPLHLRHKQELARRLPGRFYELYGLTEGFVTVLDPYDFAVKPGSVGIPPPLYEMRIVDDSGADVAPGEVGEIVGRGPITMPGYWRRPDLTAEAIRDGWLHSGDLGFVDRDGFLFLVDRKKDLIISGGVNVYPRDIEEVIIRHPDVVDVAVFGAADDRWGESPIAAVRLTPGSTTNPEEVREWVNQRVEARFQRVREVVVRDEFPLSVAGKTLRRVLRDEYAPESDEA